MPHTSGQLSRFARSWKPGMLGLVGFAKIPPSASIRSGCSCGRHQPRATISEFHQLAMERVNRARAGIGRRRGACASLARALLRQAAARTGAEYTDKACRAGLNCRRAGHAARRGSGSGKAKGRPITGPPFLVSASYCSCDQNFKRTPKRTPHSEPLIWVASTGGVKRLDDERLANWYCEQAVFAQVTLTIGAA